MKPDLDAIAARWQQAAEGPWVVGGRPDYHEPITVDAVNAVGAVRYNVCGDIAREDAIAIAHARTDVPELVAYARRLQDALRVEVGVLTTLREADWRNWTQVADGTHDAMTDYARDIDMRIRVIETLIGEERER